MTANDATISALNLYTKSLRKQAKLVRAQEAPLRGGSIQSRQQRIDLLRREFESARDECVSAVMELGRRA